MMRRSMMAALTCGLISWTAAVQAEGVIWQLPPDGTWVRLEGTYSQTEIRPNSATGKLEITPWIERLWIKSVGEETAEFQGESVACRWLEIKVERGRERDGQIDTGMTGLQIYKVLVPEAKVLATTVDDTGVPVSFLPVVKGYYKLGKAEPKEMTQSALQLYPLAVLAGYYRQENVVAAEDDPEVKVGPIKAEKIESKLNIESLTGRTVQDVTVWRSKDVPFGIARYEAKILRETKDAGQNRDEFKPATEITVSLKAQETGDDAKSDLAVP